MQTKNPLWIIFPIALAVAFFFYFLFNALNDMRSQLGEARLVIQNFEKRDAEGLTQLNDALQKIQTVEKSGTDSIQQMQAVQQKILALEKSSAENTQQLKDAQQKIQTIQAATPAAAIAVTPSPDIAGLKTQVDALVKKQDTAIAASNEANKKLQDSLTNGLVDHERFENMLLMTYIPAGKVFLSISNVFKTE